MSKPGILSTCLLILLAGCSTASRRAPIPATPDWSLAEKNNLPLPELEHVAEAQQLAPPAGALPEPFRPDFSSRSETWLPMERWSREEHAGVWRKIAAAPVPVFSLSASNGVLVLQTKSLLARWNGLVFHLGFEPQMAGGQMFVHALDLEKNLKPLLRPFDFPGKTNRVIVIDPGHGGRNTGTESVLGQANEKEFTLDWARRLARRLATNGWQVWLTRTNDADISLSNRVAFAEERHADLFLSLHFNSAAPNREQSGLETYCLTPVGMPSTLKRGYEDDAALVFPNNAFDPENFLLGMRLHRALLKESFMADRGVRRARFLGVLRGQNRPAILIESGYLSSPREARRIADPAYREKLAEAVAQALK